MNIETFNIFLNTFIADPLALGPATNWTEQDTMAITGFALPSYTKFIRQIARSSYNDNLLRFLLPNSNPSLISWNAKSGWSEHWERWRERLIVFGFDWLGRQIAFDKHRMKGGEPMIAILEPGTGELLEVPETFPGFIVNELVNFTDAALAVEFYKQWILAGGAVPTFAQCIGYKIPLFLGGKDSIENIHLTDLDVYISVCGQLESQARNLPPGTPIKGFKLS